MTGVVGASTTVTPAKAGVHLMLSARLWAPVPYPNQEPGEWF
jgi:hypothetical protein